MLRGHARHLVIEMVQHADAYDDIDWLDVHAGEVIEVSTHESGRRTAIFDLSRFDVTGIVVNPDVVNALHEGNEAPVSTAKIKQAHPGGGLDDLVDHVAHLGFGADHSSRPVVQPRRGECPVEQRHAASIGAPPSRPPEPRLRLPHFPSGSGDLQAEQRVLPRLLNAVFQRTGRVCMIETGQHATLETQRRRLLAGSGTGCE